MYVVFIFFYLKNEKNTRITIQKNIKKHRFKEMLGYFAISSQIKICLNMIIKIELEKNILVFTILYSYRM